MSLEINYRLTGSGWAECDIYDGEQSCTVTASYLTDAFGDLVLSAVVLLHSFSSLSFRFEEEPGEFRWIFAAKPNGLVDFKILDCDEDDKIDQVNPRLDDECKLIFETVCSRIEFGNAILNAGDKLLEEYGETGYVAKWVGYPFPTEKLNELRQLLKLIS